MADSIARTMLEHERDGASADVRAAARRVEGHLREILGCLDAGTFTTSYSGELARAAAEVSIGMQRVATATLALRLLEDGGDT